ncbi:hypothetical protein CEXT_202001, partial [Caerostris extrusa]
MSQNLFTFMEDDIYVPTKYHVRMKLSVIFEKLFQSKTQERFGLIALILRIGWQFFLPDSSVQWRRWRDFPGRNRFSANRRIGLAFGRRRDGSRFVGSAFSWSLFLGLLIS